MPARAFISYSHDSSTHEDRVRALADRLRQQGIDAVLDQYNPAPPDGWPLWTDREIQKADFVVLVCTETYLRRVEGREEPTRGRGVLWEARLIYNHLYQTASVQQFVPVLLEGASPSDIPWPVRGLTNYWVDTPQGYEDFYRHLTSQPRHEKPVLGVLQPLPASALQSYPASLALPAGTQLPNRLDRRNRRQMLIQVRIDWIDGVLNHSLYNLARIEPDLKSSSDPVDHPLLNMVQAPDSEPLQLPAGTTIGQIFDSQAGSLLVLGEPGTGKTTLLLELLQELLNRAERDESYPMPAVFNLSSWAKRCRPIARWLVDELNERSGVPKRVAQQWVTTEQIIPLLDGLDEVDPIHRQACVKAINLFRRDHGLLPIAVCSRITDYEDLGTRLRLRSAVIVQPLTKIRVQEYLTHAGEPLRKLAIALSQDPSLWELLQTPLMLWIAMLAYRHAPVEYSSQDSLDQRCRAILVSFVDAMFKRRSSDLRYTQAQTERWLSALASDLIRNRATVFQLEDLTPAWLPARTQRFASKIGLLLLSGLIGPVLGLTHGIITSLVYTLLTLGHTGGLAHFSSLLGVTARSGLELWGPQWGSLALGFGLAGMFLELRPTETFRITAAGMSSRLGRALRIGLLLAAMVWLGFCPLLLSSWDSHAMRAEPNVQYWLLLSGLPPAVLSKWFGALAFGFLVLPTVGLIVGAIVLVSGEVLQGRRSPNQGTRRSVKTALAAVTILALIGGVIGLLHSGPFFKPAGRVNANGLITGFILGLSYGLTAGLIIGMVTGGLFSLRHFVVRATLRINNLAPLRYVRFLDHAADRLFLRKVGGGYLFVHREVMEYFASQNVKRS